MGVFRIHLGDNYPCIRESATTWMVLVNGRESVPTVVWRSGGTMQSTSTEKMRTWRRRGSTLGVFYDLNAILL